MIPGPDSIVACPSCERLLSVPSLMSGNTFGATFWTDGKIQAPMLPDLPRVGACSHCGSVFWVEDAEVVGEVNLFPRDETIPAEWRDAPEPESLSEQQLLDAIDAGLFTTPERERHLRLMAWHALNDRYRDNPTAGLQFDDRERANIEWISELECGSGDWDDLFLSAEAFRQLGEFEIAANLLNHINVEAILRRREFLKQLCRDQCRIVREIPLEDNEA